MWLFIMQAICTAGNDGAAPPSWRRDLSPRVTDRFFLARHGETNFNAEGRVQGTLDTSVLTLAGIAQASALGQAIAESLAEAERRAVFAYTAERAKMHGTAPLTGPSDTGSRHLKGAPRASPHFGALQ